MSTAQQSVVGEVIESFESAELHAPRSGREAMRAFAQVAADSTAPEALRWADEVEPVIDALLAVMPANAPPINVMHLVMFRSDLIMGIVIEKGILSLTACT